MQSGWRMVVRQHGGPETIEREQFDVPQPGADEVVIAIEAIGLNFIDTYYRTGLYTAPLPLVLGSECAGTIESVGSDVTTFKPGDRVGCVNGAGAYATHRVCPVSQLIALPDTISSKVAAATMLKGFTASYLAEDIVPLSRGQRILVHSAAGGVGSILVPWLKDKGVEVIAHVGSPKKESQVDADHVLSCPFDELADRVRLITGGQGIDAVLDGVGEASWKASLRSLKRRGMLISYGNASGPVPPIRLLDLMRAGSVSVTRPTLADFIATPDDLERTGQRLFSRIASGVIRPRIGQTWPLAEAADAHRALEARQTVGSTILIP